MGVVVSCVQDPEMVDFPNQNNTAHNPHHALKGKMEGGHHTVSKEKKEKEMC